MPASIGAQLAAAHHRPRVLVGDGAFQVTGVELATSVRHGLTPIVVVLNNNGSATERLILDGGFNDVLNWAYRKLPELLGAGTGYLVETEGQLDAALTAATAQTEGYALLEVRLERLDVSPALRRLSERLNRAAVGAGHELGA